MTFVESGQLDLDTPLYQIYPHPDLLDDSRHQLLTARMLLTHSSGLPNWREDFEDKKLKFIQDPGTGYLYSGEGYQYLAMVLKEIEKTDWKGLEEVFQQRVAKPLSLKHTGFIQSPYMRAKKAKPYDEDGELIDWRNNYWFQKEDTIFTAPASIHSEPQEFGLWMISIMDETVLQKSSFNTLLKPQIKIPDSPFPVDYGLGFVKLNLSFTDIYYHSGNNIGFTSSFVLDKKKKWGFVLFSNSEYGEELGLELLLFLIAGESNGKLAGGIAILILGAIAGIIWLLVIGFRKVTSA
jgi:CubicO group peptidase (beta-lactamase class C family)